MKGKWGDWREAHVSEGSDTPRGGNGSHRMSPQVFESQKWVVAVGWYCFERGMVESRHVALGEMRDTSILGRRELRSRNLI